MASQPARHPASPLVVCVGRANVDYLYTLDRFPREDTETGALHQSVAIGGNAGRSAITAGRLGGVARLLAMCGTGPHADILRDHLAAEPVEVRLFASDQPSQHSFVLLAAASGTRTIVSVPQPRASRPMMSAVEETVLGADAVLLDCTDPALTASAVSTCRERGIPVVVDPGSHQPDHEHLLRGVDHIIAPRHYFAARTPGLSLEEALTRAYQDLRPQVIAATCGADGGLYLDPDGPRWYEPSAVPTVDSCGAGDSFHGAFTWAIAAGSGVELAFKIAAWVAGLQCAHLGNEGLPDGAALRSYLSERHQGPVPFLDSECGEPAVMAL